MSRENALPLIVSLKKPLENNGIFYIHPPRANDISVKLNVTFAHRVYIVCVSMSYANSINANVPSGSCIAIDGDVSN